ncbi:MAG: hypothetical protein M0C28_12385 [Candidatus Moduliflexus flocculans]|nr:hypothetical protein [Candidatus Moduliflexus flocculans]
MSEFMITGNEKRTKGEEGSWEVIWADDVEHTRGLRLRHRRPSSTSTSSPGGATTA